MCVGFWSLEEHPDYALILCTNRDEYLSRPTVDAHFHCFEHEKEGYQSDLVLSGRDLQAGGTWFGVNRYGEIGLLTNVTEVDKSRQTSRGYLVSSFLLDDSTSASQFIQRLPQKERTQYSGFNLVLFSRSDNSLSYNAELVTNSGGGGIITSRPLTTEERRCGGVSNGVDSLGGNTWPKVQAGRSALKDLLSGSVNLSEVELTNRLFELLTYPSSTEPPMNRSQLRQAVHIKPIRLTPSLAPDAPADGPEYYGTRLSTVLLIRKDGQVLFIERDTWRVDSEKSVMQGRPEDQRVFRFHITQRAEPTN